MQNTLSPNVVANTVVDALATMNEIAAHAVEGLVHASGFIRALIEGGLIKDEAIEKANAAVTMLEIGAVEDGLQAMAVIETIEKLTAATKKPSIIVPGDFTI